MVLGEKRTRKNSCFMKHMSELPARKNGPRSNGVREAAIAACGMCSFALFAHSGSATVFLSGCGLLATLFAIYRSMKAEPSAAALFGFSHFTGNTAACAAFGLVLGGVLAMLFRWNSGLSILPAGIGTFAPVAACIGIAEEVLYRGYIQGRLVRLGAAWAVIGAAACHTAYKCALFAFFPTPAVQTDMGFLALYTFLGGLGFGALRQYSGSVVPPLAAHAAFDVVVYGGLARAPSWVWA